MRIKCSFGRLTAARGLVVGLVVGLAAGCGSAPNGDPGTSLEPYDAELAAELAVLSLGTYQQLLDFERGRAFVLPPPYEVRLELETTERFGGEDFFDDEPLSIGFVATAGRTIYVAFRGTQTIAEWLGNASASQKDYVWIADGGRTHRGFTSMYATFRDALVPEVQALAGSGDYDTLYVTGHSLGGALAVLAAPDLGATTALAPTLYSFGAPRVGDATFQERYGQVIPTSWRVVNDNDTVPKLPPRTVITVEDILPEEFFYTHVKEEREIRFGSDDIDEIVEAHDICGYLETICAETSDPAACRASASGLAGCGT